MRAAPPHAPAAQRDGACAPATRRTLTPRGRARAVAGLGQPPPVVYAPGDNDTSVRRPTESEASAPGPLDAVTLRFGVGDAVSANLGEQVGFVPGKILRLLPSVGPPPGRPGPPCVAAYEVQLLSTKADDGRPRTVFAPQDDDSCIRKREPGKKNR